MKRPRLRPLADLVGPVLGPALAAQGFSGSDIVASWTEVAGERLAAVSRPIKVEWPRRRPGIDTSAKPEPATVVIRVEGAYALELQHLAPLLLERINAVYGWRCVGRIVLKQGLVGPRAAPARARPGPSDADLRQIATAVEPIEAEPLRRALARLGSSIAAEKAQETG